MEAKEKAQELVEKYEKYLFDKFTTDEDWVKCVQCALIAVQEIINANPHSNPLNTDVYSTMDYWQQVKTEINNL
jgi:hypothetical protein